MYITRHCKIYQIQKMICMMIVVCIAWYRLYGPKNEKLFQLYFKSIDVDNKHLKTILVYTPWFDTLPWWIIPTDYNFTRHDGQPCEVQNCQVTYNKRYFDHSDAVLFHSRDMVKLPVWHLKKLRKQDSNRIWIWLMQENPCNTKMNLKPLDNVFNWTVTYCPSSDVFMPYSDISKLGPNDKAPKPGINFAKGRTRQALFINGQCDNIRMGFIKSLKKYSSVDVFGKCKQMANLEIKRDCPPGKSSSCMELEREYKFYISIENGFCDGYVTEKYYKHGLRHNLIPVVINGADFNNRKVAIPHSYINALDFKDMKSLGEYLNYLDKNDTAYNEYHQWRYSYTMDRSLNFMCGICKSLWDQEKPRKTVKLSEFWGESTCISYDEEFFQKYLKT